MRHTKEPWSLNTELAMVCDAEGENIKNTFANLRRIVFCVNSCAGIPSSVLEESERIGMRPSELLMHQRDDLLEALKQIRRNAEVYSRDSLYQIAVDAIDKVEQ